MSTLHRPTSTRRGISGSPLIGSLIGLFFAAGFWIDTQPAAGQSADASTGKSVLQPQSDSSAVTLRYRLQAGDRLEYEVTHVAKTKTSVNKKSETSNVHSISKRHWEVTQVSPDGNIVFDHIVDAVEMTQQQGDKEELRWDSSSGQPAPSVFRVVADQIGKSLATVTVDPRGQEVQRQTHGGSESTLGMGSLTLLLPEHPIRIGESWTVPRETMARTADGQVKTIKIQEVYTLEKVQTGVATLEVRSEPLTPMNDDAVRAQVVQQLSNGKIKFDIDNGRLIEKELNWDENIIGFQGPTSAMEYRARMTETLVGEPTRTATLVR